MNIKQLIEKLEEIKRLAEDISTNDPISDNNLSKILAICEDIEIDYQVEERLRKVNNEPNHHPSPSS